MLMSGRGGTRRAHAIRALLAAGGCGVALGIAARIAMRFVARESGLDSAFSVGGSLEVVAFGALVGAPIAWLFFAVRPLVRLPVPWAGVLAGCGLFLVLSLVPLPAARSALAATPDTPAATALTFAVVFIAWGWLLERVGRRLQSSKVPGFQGSTVPKLPSSDPP
jgi:hypothetical protein